MAQHPGKHRGRIASLALLALLMATARAVADTPVRGLACVRGSENVYALFPLVPGPRHSIRALRADFKPLWLTLADTSTRALDSRCLVETSENGYLIRMEVDHGAWRATVTTRPIEIVASNANR